MKKQMYCKPCIRCIYLNASACDCLTASLNETGVNAEDSWSWNNWVDEQEN